VIPPAAVVQTEGRGPDLVLVHGTASDAASFAPLARLLRERLRVTRYDRRGTPAWPVGAGAAPLVDDHAEDLVELVARLGGPVHVFGASFGAVVALELARRRPHLVKSAALFEPALGPDQELPAVPRALLAEFERAIARGEPERAAESFHRRLLSDAGWRRLPPQAKERARGLWRHIHADLAATAAHRVRAEDLAGLDLPCLLLRGGRSHEAFEAPVRALCEALPQARRAVLPRAGHQTFAAAWRELADALAAFAGV
jgi:pimeloyl-ACP methyl ester carboxylesterase